MIDAKQLHHQLDEMFKYLLNQCSLNPESKKYFHKAQTICDEFGTDYGTRYSKRIEELYNNATKMEKNAKELIDSNGDYKEIYSYFGTLGTLKELEKEFAYGNNDFNISGIAVTLKDYLINSLKDMVTIVKTVFESTSSNDQVSVKSDVMKLKPVFNSLSNCNKTFSIPDVGIDDDTRNQIKKLYKNYIDSIVEYFKSSLDGFSKSLRKQMEENVRSSKTSVSLSSNDSKLFLKQICCMREMNNDIKMKTSNVYYQAIQNIIGNLQHIRGIFNETVQQIGKHQAYIDYSKLVLCVNVLRKYSWIFELRDGDTSVLEQGIASKNENNEILDAIDDILIKHCRKLFDEAGNLFIDSNNPDSVLVAKQLLDSLSGLKELQQMLPNITEPLNQVGIRLQMDVRNVLRKMQKEFTIPRQETDKVNGNDEKENKEESKYSKKARKEGAKFARLDGKRASNSINFINKCKPINWFTPIRHDAINLSKNKDKSKDESKEEKNMNDDGTDSNDMETMIRQEMGKIPMKQEIRNSHDAITNYLRAYGEYRQEEMEKCLYYLTDLQSKEAGLHANSKAIVLSNGLRELQAIKKRYNVLMPYLSEENLLSEWQTKFEQERDEMEPCLKQWASHKDPRLQIGVMHAKALGKIDWFLKDYCRLGQDRCFRPLCNEYQEQVDPSPEIGQLRELIQKGEYMKVQQALEELKKSVDVAKQLNSGDLGALEKSFSSAQQTLGHQLHEKAESAHLQIINFKSLPVNEDLDEKQLTTVQKELKSFGEARNYCGEFLTESDKKKIERFVEDSKQSIINLVEKIVDHAQPAIVSDDFVTAEKDIKRIQRIRDTLAGALSTMDAANEGESTSNKLLGIKAKVREMVTTRLAEIEKRFTDVQLKDITYNPYTGNGAPKRIYSQLEKVMQDGQGYRTLWDKIEIDLLEKVRNEFDRSRQLSFSECIVIQQLAEKIIDAMPDTIHQVLKSEFDIWKTDIIHIKELEEVNHYLEINDCEALNVLYWNYYNGNDKANATKIRDMVHDKLLKLRQETIDDLSNAMMEKKAVSNVQQRLKTAHRFVTEFARPMEGGKKEPISMLVNVYADIMTAVVDKYTACVDSIARVLSQQENSRETNDLLDNSSTFVVAMYKFENSNKKIFDLVSDSSTANFSDGIAKIMQKVNEYFHSLNEKFERCFDALDMNGMKKILDRMTLSQTTNCKLMDNLSEIDNYNIKIEMSYQDMIDKIEDKMIEIQNYLIEFDFTDTDAMRTENQKITVYESIKDKVSVLKMCKALEDHLKVDTHAKYLDKTLATLEKNITEVCDKTTIDTLKPDIDVLTKINNRYSNLKVLAQTNITGGEKTIVYLKKACNDIENNIHKCISSKREEALKCSNDAEKLAPLLAELQLFKTVLIEFSSYCEKVIDDCLNAYKQNGRIVVLMTILETDEAIAGGWGNVLVAEHSMFSGEAVNKFNKLMQEAGIDEVLKKIGSNDKSVDTKKIKSRWEMFDKKYKDLVEKNLRKNPDLKKLVGNAERIARDCAKQMVSKNGWGTFLTNAWKNHWKQTFKDDAVKLMAHVVAIWTLQNSQYYFESGKNGNKKEDRCYLMQPRVAQVVSIIRLLSIDVSEREMVNNLVEIGTGEGKSFTLAVASCILAMIGFDVSCACYSEYLSDRDYKSFEELFRVLNVAPYIHYGSFNKICENIINKKGDIRSLAKSMILGKEISDNKSGSSETKENEERKCILLIDEVDVFFSEEFYGNIYTPAAVIKHDSIEKITDLIWRDHEEHGTTKDWKLNLNKIKRQAAYGELKKKFGKWTTLLDEAIKDMLVDVREFEKHADYVIKDYKIGYKDGDQISTTATLGYKTLFTYYKEKARVSPQSFKDSIAIYIKCGNFSYAEIPSRKNFVSILGVTGTLQQLSQKEKEIMTKNYEMTRYTYIPSLFGDRKNRFTFEPKNDIRLHSDDDYFRELTLTIQEKMNEKGKDRQRCVFVCFESNQKMNEFLKCQEFAAFAPNTLVLNEEVNEKEKDRIVKIATLSGNITLFSRIFGRGTDFQVNDDKVKNNGGPHVIQTFLSRQLSEEVQIQGRTARQGSKGSYSMVLRRSEIETFDITEDDLRKEEKKDPGMYNLLHEKRLLKFEQEYNQVTQTVVQAQRMHEETEILAQALQGDETGKRNPALVQEKLIDLNRGASLGSPKIVVLMDATGSMGGLLTQAKNTVKVIVDRVAEICIKNNMDPKYFQMQFIAYRSYDAASHDLLLQMSGWSSDSALLQKFLKGVDARFGQGEEAVEVALQHVNRMVEEDNDDIAAVLLIGDAPPTKTPEDVKRYRELYSSKYDWAKSVYFSQETYWKDELEKMVNNGVPLNTYYLQEWAKPDFEVMANKTKGKCQPLDVNSKSSAEELTAIVAKTILDACGGKAGKALVDEYEKMFPAEKSKLMHT